MIVMTVEMRSVSLSPPRQKGCLQGCAVKSLRMVMTLQCYTTNSFAKNSEDGDVESLLSLTPFMPPTISFVFVMSLCLSDSL
jgi:hypothetical protein